MPLRKIPRACNFFLDSAERVALRCARSAARLARSRAPSRAGPSAREKCDWHALCFNLFRLRTSRWRKTEPAPRDGFASRVKRSPRRLGRASEPARHPHFNPTRSTGRCPRKGAPARVFFGREQWAEAPGRNGKTRYGDLRADARGASGMRRYNRARRHGRHLRPNSAPATPDSPRYGPRPCSEPHARPDTRRRRAPHTESAVRSALVAANGNRHRAGSTVPRPRGRAERSAAERRDTPARKEAFTCPRARALRGSRRSRC